MDVPVDDIPPPSLPRHGSPGPPVGRIGPFSSQNPSSGSALGMMHFDHVPLDQPDQDDQNILVPWLNPDLPVPRFNPDGPYLRIGRRRQQRGIDGPFSSNPNPTGKYLRRDGERDVTDARKNKKKRR
jgi:hypothetical protein